MNTLQKEKRYLTLAAFRDKHEVNLIDHETLLTALESLPEDMQVGVEVGMSQFGPTQDIKTAGQRKKEVLSNIVILRARVESNQKEIDKLFCNHET